MHNIGVQIFKRGWNFCKSITKEWRSWKAKIDERTDIFQRIGHALVLKQAVAIDHTELQDMYRYYLIVAWLTRT